MSTAILRHLERSILMAVVLGLAAAALAHPSLDARIAELSHRIAEEPAEAGARLLERAGAHADHADWRAARADVEAARSLDSEVAGLDLMSARIALGEGAPMAALSATDQALERAPQDADAWSLRGRILMDLGRASEASVALGHAIENIRPPARPQPDLYLARARALSACSPPRTDHALRTLDAGLTRLGPLVSLALPAIDLEISLGRFDAALRRLDALPIASADRERRRAAIVVMAAASAAASVSR